jgi:hypothetical protein
VGWGKIGDKGADGGKRKEGRGREMRSERGWIGFGKKGEGAFSPVQTKIMHTGLHGAPTSSTEQDKHFC